MRSFAIVALCFVAGCIRSQLGTCGDLLCPIGTVCTARGCVQQEQIEACNGLADGAACASFSTAVCIDGVCVEQLCGDGETIGSEACDDGNQRSGDGCSADCVSREECGNGYVDTLVGEQCDDGARGLSGDGCTSACTIEVSQWHDATPTLPSARGRHVAAYDSARGRIVVFGGSGAFFSTETWELAAGGVWRRFDVAGPSPRNSAVMVYDPKHARTILFGGNSGSVNLADTWAWDGRIWEQLSPATSPPARSYAGFAYDPVHEYAVLYGGYGTNAMLGDTWIWNGDTWSQQATTATPFSGAASIAWDPTSQSLILVAGAETWQWTGTDWTPLPTAPLSNAVISTSANGVLLLGGSSQLETWLFADGQWAQLAPNQQPTDRSQFTMTYDSTRNLVIVFAGSGGCLFGGGCYYDDYWIWTNSNWYPGYVSGGPTGGETPIAYQPGRGTAILFGGWQGALSVTPETYEWDGMAWQAVSVISQPSGRLQHILVATRDHVLMFGGGYPNGTPYADATWLWTGTAWVQPTLAVSPPVRRNALAAYDAARNRVVMFGGFNAGDLDDTWEWDGTQWERRTPATVPPARHAGAMAYDARRQRVVMFGGAGASSTMLGDTWEWDGTDWIQRMPATSPLPRSFASAAYDPLRGTVVMFGGLGATAYSDTWEWNGTTWHRIDVATSPPPRSGHASAFDAVHGRMIVFAGPSRRDTWVLETSSATTPRDECREIDTDNDGLVGCADPDCWGRCTPWCPPGAPCDPNAAHCGDGTCGAVEDARICPSDCP